MLHSSNDRLVAECYSFHKGANSDSDQKWGGNVMGVYFSSATAAALLCNHGMDGVL